MIRPEYPKGDLLSTGGAVTLIASGVGVLLILFLLPGVYSAVSGMLLLVMAFAFIVGVFLFLAGKLLRR